MIVPILGEFFLILLVRPESTLNHFEHRKKLSNK